MPLWAAGTTPVEEDCKGDLMSSSTSSQYHFESNDMHVRSGHSEEDDPVRDLEWKLTSNFGSHDKDALINISSSRNSTNINPEINSENPSRVSSSNSSDSGSSFDEKRSDTDSYIRFDDSEKDRLNFPDAGFAFSATTQIMKMFGTQLPNNKESTMGADTQSNNNFSVNSFKKNASKEGKIQNKNEYGNEIGNENGRNNLLDKDKNVDHLETSSQPPRTSRNSFAYSSPIANNTAPSTPEKEKRTNIDTTRISTATPKKKGSYPQFIEKLKQPAASDVARSIRIFVSNFEKRLASKAPVENDNPINLAIDGEVAINANLAWGEEDVFNADRMPGEDNEDAKNVQQFLRKLEQQVRSHSCWRSSNNTEWENTVEGLERFVVKRIYDLAFTASPQDRRRDMILKHRIRSLRFLHPGHLGSEIITNKEETNMWEGEWKIAAAELNKINKFKAPRDKVVCILNCCRIVARLLRNAMNAKNDVSALPGTGEGADDLIPALIYTVIVANPDNLYSNIEFVAAYRNPNGFKGEAGYFFTILTSAVSFIQTLTADVLTGISEEEFNAGIVSSLNCKSDVEVDVDVDIDVDVDACLNNPQKQQTLGNDLDTKSVNNEDDIQELHVNQLKFMEMDAANLTLAQIPELLEDYKKLATLCEKLQREISKSKSNE